MSYNRNWDLILLQSIAQMVVSRTTLPIGHKDLDPKVVQSLKGSRHQHVKPLPNIQGSIVLHQHWFNLGYHQVHMEPHDVWKGTFRTKFGLYKLLVMPFGLTIVVSTSIWIFNIFHPLGKIVVVHLDDILIYNKSSTKKLDNFRILPDLLHQHKLQAKNIWVLSVIQHAFILIQVSSKFARSGTLSLILMWTLGLTFFLLHTKKNSIFIRSWC